jgi:hypothetical protein
MSIPQTPQPFTGGASSYPCSSPRLDVSKRTASDYHQILLGHGSTSYGKVDLFVDDKKHQKVHILDYCTNLHAFQPIKSLEDEAQLQNEIQDAQKDPKGRYMYGEANCPPLLRLITDRDLMTPDLYMPEAIEIRWTARKSNFSTFYIITRSCLLCWSMSSPFAGETCLTSSPTLDASIGSH